MLFTKRNKLFIFGDSFSFGDGCRKGDEYYERTKLKNGKTWFELIAEEYNLDIQMYAGCGFSNPETLRLLTENLYKIDKNDIVIIGLTDYYRFELLHEYGFKKLFFHSFSNYEDLDKMKFIDNSQGDENWSQAAEYYAKYILHPNHIQFMSSLSKSFRSIYKFLNNNSINTLMWTWDWSVKNSDIKYIETKKDWTINHEFSDIDDFHYSWKGHSEFYKKITKLLKNKINFI